MSFSDMFLNTKGSTQTKSYKRDQEFYRKAADVLRANRESLLKEDVDTRNNNILTASRVMGYSEGYRREKFNKDKARLQKKFTKKFFTDRIYKIFMEALPLDAEMKYKYAERLKALCRNVINETFESQNITPKVIREGTSMFLRDLYNLCEEKAEKAATKIAEENLTKITGEEVPEGDVLEEKDDDSSEEESSYDNDFEEYEEEESDVSELVAQKVVQVVYDEEKAAEQNKEVQDNIDSGIAEMQMDGEEIDAESDADPDNQAASTEDLQSDENKLEEAVKYFTRAAKLPDMSLFQSIYFDVAKKYVHHLGESMETPDKQVKVNMDYVLAETIIYYTLLELMHTTSLIKMNARDARALAKRLFIENTFSKGKKKKTAETINEENVMKSTLTEKGLSFAFKKKTLTPYIVKHVESALKIEFPKEFKNCVMKNNGGKPTPNKAISEGGREFSIGRFYSLHPQDRENIINVAKRAYSEFKMNIIPFACDDKDNYFCFDYRERGVVEPSIVYANKAFKGRVGYEPTVVSESFKSFVDGIMLIHEQAQPKKDVNAGDAVKSKNGKPSLEKGQPAEIAGI